VEEQAGIVEQVLTPSAVNNTASTFTTTPQLIDAMLKKATKLRDELAIIVSIHTQQDVIIIILYTASQSGQSCG